MVEYIIEYVLVGYSYKVEGSENTHFNMSYLYYLILSINAVLCFTGLCTWWYRFVTSTIDSDGSIMASFEGTIEEIFSGQIRKIFFGLNPFVTGIYLFISSMSWTIINWLLIGLVQVVGSAIGGWVIVIFFLVITLIVISMVIRRNTYRNLMIEKKLSGS